jgi:disulfide bond formation protein DsbB
MIKLLNKCILCTYQRIQFYWALTGFIKFLLIGVDKEYFMIHNENMINGVNETLN